MDENVCDESGSILYDTWIMAKTFPRVYLPPEIGHNDATLSFQKLFPGDLSHV